MVAKLGSHPAFEKAHITAVSGVALWLSRAFECLERKLTALWHLKNLVGVDVLHLETFVGRIVDEMSLFR